MALLHMFLALPAAAVVGNVLCLMLIQQPLATMALHTSNLNQLSQWQGAAPGLAAFASYEDMQHYVNNRADRRLRQLDNPTDDSYINAYNQHNEQPALEAGNLRPKRQTQQRSLPNEPRLFRFEISDAVEPSDEVKQLIKKHRSREQRTATQTLAQRKPNLQNENNRNVMRLTNTAATAATAATGGKHVSGGRVKRKAPRTTVANFQVQLIPFLASDAREPDEETKLLIKRNRALELATLQSSQTTSSTPILPKPQRVPKLQAKLPVALPTVPQQPPSRAKAGKLRMKSLHKRTRRAANQKISPKMTKFELEDAKEPDQYIKTMLQQQQLTRQSKEMQEESLKVLEKHNTTHFERKSDTVDSSADIDDTNSEESKHFYYYKEAPPKAKKSINSLPHDVQKVITNLMKENQGAKAYIKYLPAQKMDYNNLRSMAYSGAKAIESIFHGQKRAAAPAYVKYMPAAPQPQLQVQIHPVPVVENVRYVYTPVSAVAPNHANYLPAHYASAKPAAAAQQQLVAHPIVVADAAYGKRAAPQISEVHHTYSADLNYAYHQSNEAKEDENDAQQQAQVQHFHASKPDPYLEERKVAQAAAEKATALAQAEAGNEAHNYIPVENYKYEVISKMPQGYLSEAAYGKAPQRYQQHALAPNPTTAPLIKIEYHAAPNALKQNYKQMAEFKELSQLMGKSPEDQIHGLTYLLAKEMQSKLRLQRQQKKFEDEAQPRPQDNTSPILFHPAGDEEAGEQEEMPKAAEVENGYLGVQPGRLIGMGKSKQYIPIVEQVAAKASESQRQAHSEQQHLEYESSKKMPKVPPPSSFVQYALSPNYEHVGKPATQVIHHNAMTHHGFGGAGGAYHKVQAKQKQQHGAGGGGQGGGSGEKTHAGEADGAVACAKLHFRTHIDERNSLQYASKYAFGYRIRDFSTGNDFGHKENLDLDGVTRGQYHILLPDGRIQNVIYHADDTGFHADVSFETGH